MSYSAQAVVGLGASLDPYRKIGIKEKTKKSQLETCLTVGE